MKKKKLQKTLIKSQKYRIQQLRDNNQIQVNDLARKIRAVDADRETWIIRHNALESQSKALQTNSSEFEKGMIALSESNERLREENKSLQSANIWLKSDNERLEKENRAVNKCLDKFNDLKSGIGEQGVKMKHEKLQLGNLRKGEIFYFGKDKVKMQKISNSECVEYGTDIKHEMRIDMFVYVEVKR